MTIHMTRVSVLMIQTWILTIVVLMIKIKMETIPVLITKMRIRSNVLGGIIGNGIN